MPKNGKATDVAKDDGIVTLTTGVKVKINPAPALLIEQAANSIEMPKVPVQELEDGRKLENPTHPDYLEAQQDALRLQSQAAIDTMIVFVDLMEEIPELDEWYSKLRYLVRLKHLNGEELAKYDMDDPDDKAFVYKKFIAFSSDDLAILSAINGISEEDRALARQTFQGSA